MARHSSFRRFAALELGVWASLYPAYLAIRQLVHRRRARRDRARIEPDRRRARDRPLFHEAEIQNVFGPIVDVLSAYYMLGFGPLIVAVLAWLVARHRDLYRQVRTLLLGSLGLAVIGYIAYPTAPPRMVPGLGISDTVGMSAHDTGSVAGIRFNPYAAMPSMHVGWSLLIGISDSARAAPAG